METNTKHFTAHAAPVNPFSLQQLAGWYYRDAAGEWTYVGDYQGAEQAARHYAAMAAGSTTR